LTRTPTSVPADGSTPSKIKAAVTNSSGTTVAAGTVVTFSTTAGVFTDGCSNATPTQVCSATVATADGGEDAEAAGEANVELSGIGASGSATVTATTGGQSNTTTVTLSGKVTALAVSTQFDT